MATSKPGSSRFVPNPYLEQELKRSTMFIDELTAVGEDIVRGAQAVAPVEEADYRDAFEVAGVVTEAEGVAVRVTNTDWKAVFLEYGTSEHDFTAPFRRGVEAAGYKLEDGK